MGHKKIFRLPGAGMRSVKTAVAAVICAAVIHLLNDNSWYFVPAGTSPTALYACCAAIICMQTTLTSTLKSGLERVAGTVVGGLIGVAMLFINEQTGGSWSFWALIFLFAGTMICMVVCNVVGLPKACGLSAVVFVIIFMNVGMDDVYIYSLLRVSETVFGVLVALLVNRFLTLPEPVKKRIRARFKKNKNI